MTKIIQGQFGPKKPETGPYAAKPQAGNPDPGNPRQPSPPTLALEDQPKIPVLLDPRTGESALLHPMQQRAMAFILSGKAFVFIAMEPTATGSDFFSAVHGDPAELRAAEDHLPELIHNAYIRYGVTNA
jgi:hypothetical protein